MGDRLTEIEALRQRCEELARMYVEQAELNLANEATIRNMQKVIDRLTGGEVAA